MTTEAQDQTDAVVNSFLGAWAAALLAGDFKALSDLSLQGRLGLSLVRGLQGWRVSFYQLNANRPTSG
jgi:hypothetical protein